MKIACDRAMLVLNLVQKHLDSIAHENISQLDRIATILTDLEAQTHKSFHVSSVSLDILLRDYYNPSALERFCDESFDHQIEPKDIQRITDHHQVSSPFLCFETVMLNDLQSVQ